MTNGGSTKASLKTFAPSVTVAPAPMTEYWLPVIDVVKARSITRGVKVGSAPLEKVIEECPDLSITIYQNYGDDVEDGTLEFVFMDTIPLQENIAAWWPKLHKDGVMMGRNAHREAVKQVLDEEVPGWRPLAHNAWLAFKAGG